MRSGKRILIVVPARGGSKGVALKNLRPVARVPLVARVGQLVGGLPWIDRAVVSTDHDEIAAVAEQSGLAAPFRRPAELSGDRIGDVEVLVHALESCELHDATSDGVVVMLQPTWPLRTAQHVEQNDVPRTHRTNAAVPFEGTTVGTDLRRDLDQERSHAYVKLEREGARGEGFELGLLWQRQDESRDRVQAALDRLEERGR